MHVVEAIVQFHESLACRGHAHCLRCRQLVPGRAWRRIVLGNRGEPDFACPEGREWTHTEEPKLVIRADRVPISPLEQLARTCAPVPAGYIRQLDLLYRRPPRHVACRSRRAFRERLMAKARWYARGDWAHGGMAAVARA